ncbi:MAG: hypothetical protein J6T98_09255 [Salinivirgaceae bacterium]|nr:hypothetical protein [Salinivirgaceae bacterium]
MFSFVGGAVAQNNTISPYSKYGIGLYEQTGYGRNISMGGTGIGLRSANNVNNINPASYASIDSTMVLFDIGLHLDYEYIETHLDSGDKLNGNISYFSLTMAPNNNLGISFGISPYTSVGYTIRSIEYISGGGQDKYMSYVEGIGGLTRVYAGFGANLLKNTSIGMNVSVLFGPKTERQSLALSAADNFSIYTETSDYYHGGKLDFGLQQTIPLSKEKSLTIGAIASTPGILDCERVTLATNTFYRIGYIDTIYFDNDDYDRITTLPATFGAGLSYKSGRFTIAGDFNYNPLSKFDVADLRTKLIDNKSFCLGAEYIPKQLGRKFDLVFRGGAGFDSGTTKIDSYVLKSYRISAGVGFKIHSIRFNTYCMYKRQGTLDNLLVLDQSLQFGLNLTYIDYWFQKRRFY